MADSLLDLPAGALYDIVSFLRAGPDIAAASAACNGLRAAVLVALEARRVWSSCDNNDVSHMKASRLFKFLARSAPNLTSISCCFAADRLYGGTLLESSLGGLAAAMPHLSHLTLLNVDVTDKVLEHLGHHCPGLQHLAIGRTENNAFGNFVSDGGLETLAQSCSRLSSLWLFRCYSCSDAGLWQMTRHGRQIRSLVLHSCPQITAPGLVSFIEATPGLQLLDVLLPESGPGGAAVNFDTAFALAANCGGLKVLRLSEELLTGGVLDDESLAVVARGCTQLQELELVQVEVSDVFMQELAKSCGQLTSLRLEQTYVSGAGVDQLLSAAPKLRELRVAGCSTHSWMLPAEYMFAGLSVADLQRLALRQPAVGQQLTSLDLSCLALEPASVSEAAAIQAAAAAAVAALAAPAQVASGGDAAPAAPAPAAAAAALQHQQEAAAGVTTLLPPAWCEQLVSLSLDWLKVDALELQESLLLTLAACSSLTSLSLIGYQGSVDSLLAAVGCFTRPADQEQQEQEKEVNLPGNESSSSSCDTCGDSSSSINSTAAAAAASGSAGASPSSSAAAAAAAAAAAVVARGAGAHLKQLNLQHSLVTDAGLALAADAFPGLTSLRLGYCRLVGDTGLAAVGRMQQLEELDLYNTPCTSAAAVARLARHGRRLTRLYIGHNTSALNRSPATATAMGYINSSSNSNSNGNSNGSPSKYGSGGSVWSAVSQAAAARGAARLAVLSRNPSSESGFEKRSLQALLGGSSLMGGA